MTGDERSDPLSDVLNIFAAPLAGTIRSFDQFRKGVDEFLRGVENFNRTMETLNETAQRINVLLGEVEEPIKAAIPQITRTVKLADEVMQVVSGPAIAAAPALRQLTEIMSTPGIGQLPAQLGQFTEVMTDMSKRLGPLTQLAESAGGLFGGLRFPGTPSPRPAPAGGVERELVGTRPLPTTSVPRADPTPAVAPRSTATPTAVGSPEGHAEEVGGEEVDGQEVDREEVGGAEIDGEEVDRVAGSGDAGRPVAEPLSRRTAWPPRGPGVSLPRTSTTTCSPCAVSGGRNANAMPRPSVGEKLPLVTSPTGQPVDGDGASGARRTTTIGGEPEQPSRDAGGALGASGLAPAERRLVPRHHPAEPRLQRRDARTELVTVQRKSGFEPEGVAGAETRGGDAGRDDARPRAPPRPRPARRSRYRTRRCSRCRPRCTARRSTRPAPTLNRPTSAASGKTVATRRMRRRTLHGEHGTGTR